MFVIERKTQGFWNKLSSSELGHHSDCFYKASTAREFLVKYALRAHYNFDYRVIRPGGRRAVHVVTAASVTAWKQQQGKKAGEW